MSNLWLNMMIFGYHIQAGDPWWHFKFSYNNYHKVNGWPEGYFKIFQFFNYLG